MFIVCYEGRIVSVAEVKRLIGKRYLIKSSNEEHEVMSGLSAAMAAECARLAMGLEISDGFTVCEYI